MSVPESPYTRKEMYLDAIARGDSSGIPERPYTREEMYLDEIARNGGGGGGGGSSSLSGLTDVDISNPTDGQTLVYNATSGKWENGASGSGGVFLIHVNEQNEQTVVLDKTAKEILDAINAGKSIMIECVEPHNTNQHFYFMLCRYYAGNDRYSFDFFQVRPNYVGDTPLLSISNFGTDTENGYPVLDF